jgi:hypothetical protein
VLRGMTRQSARPRVRAGRSLGALCPVAVGSAVLLLTAGCGLIGSSSASPPGSPGSAASGYLSCLRQHGVSIPTARPTSGASGSGGFPGGGSAAFAQARQACAALRPSGGFGGGGFAAAFQAFRSCMSSHGETIPSARPTAPPASGTPGADRFLNGLNPNDPKVAAALKACQSKFPSFASGG